MSQHCKCYSVLQPSSNGMVRAQSTSVSQQPAQQQQAVAHRPTRTTDATAAIGLAVGHINSGNIEQAISLLDGAIAGSTEPNMGALVARGTARALNQNLKGGPARCAFFCGASSYPAELLVLEALV